MRDDTLNHTHVFLGPSLKVAEAKTILNAHYHPPCQQGDVYQLAIRPDTNAIVIIDGLFQTVPAVRHREILYALHQGIAVYGAASMGALRAADLEAFGMTGIGLIYRWYRATALAPDDAVAVTHSPPELGSSPISTALVDLRRSISNARKKAVIDRDTATALTLAATALPYQHRNLTAVIDKAGLQAELAVLIEQHFIEQKQIDARRAITQVAKDIADNTLPIPNAHCLKDYRFRITDAWLEDLRLASMEIENLL